MSTAEVIPLRWRPTIAFKDRLRAVRKEYGARTGNPKLTQIEFAAVLDVNDNTYKQWESGGRPRDLVAFARLVERKTGADPAWLLDVAEAGPDDGPGLDVYPPRDSNPEPAGSRPVLRLAA
jgi:transcriptional regulator with XRE-family HTH domain